MGPLPVDCRRGAGHGGRRPLRSGTASTGASLCAGRRVEGARVGGCLLGASMDLAGGGSAHPPLYRLGPVTAERISLLGMFGAMEGVRCPCM